MHEGRRAKQPALRQGASCWPGLSALLLHMTAIHYQTQGTGLPSDLLERVEEDCKVKATLGSLVKSILKLQSKYGGCGDYRTV